MRNLIIVALWLVAQCAMGAAFTSSQSGVFTDAATWGGGGYPSADGDSWTIASGHTVWYDTNNAAHENGWGASVVTGTLSITNIGAHLKMNGNLSGAGQWTIGTVETPIDYTATHTAGVVVQFKTGQCTMTGNGAIAWYGATNNWSGTITNTAAVGATNLFFADTVSGLASNDVVYIDNHNVRGLGGSMHIVYSVETNRVTFFDAITSDRGNVTNDWPGTTFGGGVATNTRTNGTRVVKLTRPIVAYQPVKITTTGLWSASHTSVVMGVAFVNFGRGPVNSLNGWVIANCTGANNTDGGIANGGTGHTISSCTVVNNSFGGIANGGTGHTISSCTGVNNSYGGITYQGIGHTISGCIGVNNFNCGIAYQGIGHTISGCTGVNNSYCGIAREGTQTIVACIADGPLLYNTYETVVYDCPTNLTGGAIVTARAPYDILEWNGTNWQSNGGLVHATNITGQSFETAFKHIPAANNTAPVPYYFDISLKPNATRSIGLWTYTASTIGMYYAVTHPGEKPLTQSQIPFVQQSTWTYFPVQLTNALAQPAVRRLWIISYSTNSVLTPLSSIEVPTDYTVEIK